jgi:hypothetical protein
MGRRTRTILFVVVGIAVLMATIHFTVNGLPDLRQFNPHR